MRLPPSPTSRPAIARCSFSYRFFPLRGPFCGGSSRRNWTRAESSEADSFAGRREREKPYYLYPPRRGASHEERGVARVPDFPRYVFGMRNEESRLERRFPDGSFRGRRSIISRERLLSDLDRNGGEQSSRAPATRREISSDLSEITRRQPKDRAQTGVIYHFPVEVFRVASPRLSVWPDQRRVPLARVRAAALSFDDPCHRSKALRSD